MEQHLACLDQNNGKPVTTQLYSWFDLYVILQICLENAFKHCQAKFSKEETLLPQSK